MTADSYEWSHYCKDCGGELTAREVADGCLVCEGCINPAHAAEYAAELSALGVLPGEVSDAEGRL